MKRSRRKHRTGNPSSKEKGDAAEQLVASMHAWPGLTVATKVRLPSKNRKGRPREIDVLITSEVAGMPVNLAIECKNENKVTGVERIDAFVGKLEDVGLPKELGIYVSTSEYSAGAIERAKAVGMKTLLLKSAKKDVQRIVREALQSVIYLLATISKVRIRLREGSPNPPQGPLLFFFDKRGKIRGSVADLVWECWRQGIIPDRLGAHEIPLELPPGWGQKYDGHELVFEGISATVAVTGYVLTLKGKLTQHNLLDASSKRTEKWQVDARFTPPWGKHPLNAFESEEQLEMHLHAKNAVRLVTGRLRLPRIRWVPLYWPPSEKTLGKLQAAANEAAAAGRELDLHSLPFSEIEGSDLAAAYDPVWQGHPFHPTEPGGLPAPSSKPPTDTSDP